MKKAFIALILAAVAASPAVAEHLVLLHTNDTHSQVDPVEKDGLGGIARRKAAIDSVRAVRPNTMLIDAGDAVQGTLFFNLYGGEVEQKVMNLLGYDLRILGNHDFDNGIDELSRMLAMSEAEMISTNYDMRGTPLADRFGTVTKRRVGDRTIGFLGVNLDPTGMIADENWAGMTYYDALAAANVEARRLKDEGVDMVVAVTHLGYAPENGLGDVDLARLSRDIDIIIGGHSHDTLMPDSTSTVRIPNLDGKPVLVTQTGKAGKYLGQIDIDLDDLTADYSLIKIDDRFDKNLDPAVDRLLEPYRNGVDSLMLVPVAESPIELSNSDMPLLNFAADFIYDRGSELADNIDLAIINKGGLRRSLPKGMVTEGQIMSMLPFDNRVWVVDMPGSDLRSVFNVMARTGGNGVSEHVRATFDPAKAVATEIMVNGQPLDDDRIYRVATIDYLAKGGDYMAGFRGQPVVAKSGRSLYADLIEYLRSGHPFTTDATVRMRPE